MSVVIGIDPGKKGAIAVLCDDIAYTSLYDKDEYLAVLSAYRREATICAIEKVHAMPKQGSVSMFNFGQNYGWIKGVLSAYGIPFQEVAPQTWKKEFGLNSDKTRSIEICHQLFPHVMLTPPGFKKPQDGIAEAMLLAEYARRKFNG